MTFQPLTRFAPSPTGYLHLGHARAAFKAFDFATRHHATCLLRIEDIDHTRCKPEYTDAIFEDLAWLGFTWPSDVRVQSQHLEDYKKTLTALIDMGVVYRCFKSRRELPKGTYRGRPDPEEREKLKARMPFSWRLSISKCHEKIGKDLLSYITGHETEQICHINDLSDEIIARKDIGTSYLLACTHDDALQHISHVVRGVDLEFFTPYQVLLQAIMGWPTPIYIHHALVKNAQGDKLSKRNKDTTLRTLRAQGVTRAELFAMAGI